MSNKQSSLEISAEADAKQALERSLQDILGTEVTVQAIHHGGKLDVRVNMPDVKDELEARHSEIRISPYSDFKFTAVELEE